MTKSIATINATADTFETWMNRTNDIATAMSTVVMTTESSSSGAINTGNAYTNGIFSANTLAATQYLRGGTVASSGRLTITSNAHFQDVGNVSSNSTYLNLKSSTGTITTTTLTMDGGSVVVASNVNIKTNTLTVVSAGRVGINTASATAALEVTGVTQVSGNLVVSNATTLQGNTSITANTVSVTSQNTTITGPLAVTANLAVTQSAVISNNLVVLVNANVGGLLGVAGDATFAANVTANNLYLTHALGIAEGGTGASNTVNARSNLGLGSIAVLNSITSSQFTNAVSLSILDSTGTELKKLYASAS